MDLSIGGAMRDRTADLLDANQALSQLSYSPANFALVKLSASIITQSPFTNNG
jgi:hypothetical protein